MDKTKPIVNNFSGPSIPFVHAGQELKAGCLELPTELVMPLIIGITSDNCRPMAYDEFVSFGRAEGFQIPDEHKHEKVVGMLIESSADDGRHLVPLQCDTIKMIALPRIPVPPPFTVTLVVIENQD